MLQRVALGQVRFNLPGLLTDGRGVAIGKQLAVRFAAIDRLVSFLRVLSAEQSLDDLQPGLRILHARGGAGTREAIVLMPVATPGLGDVVAHAARLAGGQTFTGTGKHFVQFRDASAPLGYDVPGVSDGAGDLILYGVEETVPYRIESELPLQKLVLRLSLTRVHGTPTLRDGPVYLTVRRGLGTVVAGYLYRAAASAGLRAAAALCEGGSTSAFAPGSAFWLFRVENVPPRMESLLASTPGLERYVPVTDHVAVAVGYRHPIHLDSCRRSFPSDRLHLFSPRGVTEVAPLPALAAIEDVVRVRAPAPEPLPRGDASPAVRPDLAVTLRLERSGRPAGRPVATLIPWSQAHWLKRLLYALPPTVLATFRVALLERGILLRAADALAGFPFGTLLDQAAPDVLVPVGTRIRPAVAPQLLAERLGATGGAVVVFPGVGPGGRPRSATTDSSPIRIPAEAISPLEPRILGAISPRPADVLPTAPHPQAPAERIEIENQPLGPMPLWGLSASGRDR